MAATTQIRHAVRFKATPRALYRALMDGPFCRLGNTAQRSLASLGMTILVMLASCAESKGR
jgi:hypothetical protein